MTLLDRPALLLAVWLALMSVIAFAAMGADKRRARRGGRRIPEARLFLLALLGGGIGGWLGMVGFRHKTRHWTFVIGFAAIALFQIAAVLVLLIR